MKVKTKVKAGEGSLIDPNGGVIPLVSTREAKIRSSGGDTGSKAAPKNGFFQCMA